MTVLPQTVIQRSSPVPFYFQLAELLEQEIASGRWPPGSRVPPELDLCEGLSACRARRCARRWPGSSSAG